MNDLQKMLGKRLVQITQARLINGKKRITFTFDNGYEAQVKDEKIDVSQPKEPK